MIRPARPSDAADLHAIWTPVIRGTTSIFHSTERTEEEIAALTAAGDPFLVWEEAGRILGFARCFPFRAGDGYARAVEHTVILDPDSRGRGGGRRLMQALMAEARARGKHTMWGAISAENEAGIAFHRCLGFAEQGRLREVGRKFDRWLDLVLMGRVL